MCWSSKALNCLQPDKEVNFVLKCYLLFDIFFSSSKTSLSLHKTDKILLPFHSIGKFGRRIVAIGNCCSSLWNFQEIVWIIEISQRPFKMSLQHFNSHLQAVFGNVKVALHDQSQTCKLIVLLEILNMRVHSWWICSFFSQSVQRISFGWIGFYPYFFSIGELLVQVVFDTW